ncbi:unnamed protein product, partial [Prorocentrum cordatum]
KLWSRCQQCRKCEWNHLIVKNGSCCSGCGAPVTLYKRQSPAGRHVHVEDETRGDEGKPGGKGDGSSRSDPRPRRTPRRRSRKRRRPAGLTEPGRPRSTTTTSAWRTSLK